jgi:hypothetical protein
VPNLTLGYGSVEALQSAKKKELMVNVVHWLGLSGWMETPQAWPSPITQCVVVSAADSAPASHLRTAPPLYPTLPYPTRPDPTRGGGPPPPPPPPLPTYLPGHATLALPPLSPRLHHLHVDAQALFSWRSYLIPLPPLGTWFTARNCVMDDGVTLALSLWERGIISEGFCEGNVVCMVVYNVSVDVS